MIMMRKPTCAHIVWAACLLVLLLPVLSAADGDEKKEAKNSSARALKLGGLLYDNWPKVVGVKPDGTHPLYPPKGKKKGESSWRCKECHGWDYLGKDGRYSSGSHYTGFDGILHARGGAPETLRNSLSGGAAVHDFSRWLSLDQINALTEFINRGLIDYRDVERLLERFVGGRGRQLYQQACASCHGNDGNGIDFKDKNGVQGVGWLANDNPQESLHKIRWGHPGSEMPSAVVDLSLSDEETVEILRYSRTLD